MKVKMNGKWSKHRPARGSVVSYRAEGIRLNGSDLADICNMSDRDIAKTIRSLSSRVNRPHSGGVVSNPTGRAPSWPETQFLGTRTGRWSSECPDKSQMPLPNKVEDGGLDESHHLKPGLVDIDFSEIEKRVMAQMGTNPGKQGRFYTAEVQARQEGKTAKLALELWRKTNANLVGFWIHHVIDKALKDRQTRIDEEGCGAAFAALKEWE